MEIRQTAAPKTLLPLGPDEIRGNEVTESESSSEGVNNSSQFPAKTPGKMPVVHSRPSSDASSIGESSIYVESSNEKENGNEGNSASHSSSQTNYGSGRNSRGYRSENNLSETKTRARSYSRSGDSTREELDESTSESSSSSDPVIGGDSAVKKKKGAKTLEKLEKWEEYANQLDALVEELRVLLMDLQEFLDEGSSVRHRVVALHQTFDNVRSTNDPIQKKRHLDVADQIYEGLMRSSRFVEKWGTAKNDELKNHLLRHSETLKIFREQIKKGDTHHWPAERTEPVLAARVTPNRPQQPSKNNPPMSGSGRRIDHSETSGEEFREQLHNDDPSDSSDVIIEKSRKADFSSGA